MRKIDLRISPAMTRLADSRFDQRAREIDKRYSHIAVNELTFPMMRDGDKSEYFRIHARWANQKVTARFETYRDAFRNQNVIPNDADINEMCFAFEELILTLAGSLPSELQRWLQELGEQQTIPDVRRDIQILIQEMRLEQIEAESGKSPLSSTTYNTTIHGPNYGGIQQGGQGNTQNVTLTNNLEFDTAISSIIEIIRASPLSDDDKHELEGEVSKVNKAALKNPASGLLETAKTRLDIVRLGLQGTDLLIKAGPHLAVAWGYLKHRFGC